MREPMRVLRPAWPDLSICKCQMSPVSSDLRPYVHYGVSLQRLAFIVYSGKEGSREYGLTQGVRETIF